ncbi:RING-H2 finger protein ATL52-like [Quillaja saponaria]|uniref:RING-H2 finger protein ATL52-like n=1 Tax=Quillaja saponaria TaxID=32244 RepID=A0AAD7PY44_QUISA|nr:RING-H2 finger protein ATL52-like [Quillaja saponaria]
MEFFKDDNLLPILMTLGLAALVVSIYHVISVCWCNRISLNQSPPQIPLRPIGIHSSIENSAAQLIPAHKYQKELGFVGEDGICAVCLCEFEEGEELRTLPECLHSFHVPCIDMWFYSHSSCPMCRTEATPSPMIQQHSPDSGGW